MDGLLIALILSILANVATVISLTIFHKDEKKDLHNRLMAKSPDEYIYDTQIAPLEVEALKRDFKPEAERTDETSEQAKLRQQIQKQGF